MTEHAWERIAERLTLAGWSVGQQQHFSAYVQALPAKVPPGEQAAIKCFTLPAAYGEYHTSNGNNVWAIVRDGKVQTVMLRRDNQPSTTTALRVDKVYNG